MASNSFINLKGKVVIITGASSGIGEATALEFARQSCHLMLCGRNQQRLENVVAKCKDAGGKEIKVQLTTGDIVESSVQEKIISNTISAYGRLDVLINNAGELILKDSMTTSREEFRQLFQTNLESVFFLTQLAVPHLKETKGNVVNVSSITSYCNIPQAVVYGITKAALDSYTKALAVELASFGIRVNSVNPGTVSTLLYRRGKEEITEEQYDKAIEASSPMHPLGRICFASEVADSIVFLASERASFLTGNITFVDGGRHCLGPQRQLDMLKKN